ncbi:MAG: TetR/AcrR family transcriptional regulator [Clostridia bacterium]|nr:TetR/AcrR family transcriptional regulator [Clostridia bacterium]
MPKVIENLKEQLLIEAKRQVFERGYSQTTIRSIASACGVGVGTVYNYFKSKEMLVGSFVYEDWKRYLHEMSILSYEEPKSLFKGLYDLLREFAGRNEKLFFDPEAAKMASVGFPARHKLLRSQIASFILPLCKAKNLENPQFFADFLAESIICWAMENVDFETVYPLLEKVITAK